MQTERRSHFSRIEHPAFVPILNNTKWVMPGGYVHAYCVAMGWEPLIIEADGILFRAPADFNETGTRALA